MQKLLNLLRGRKTYLCAVGAALTMLAFQLQLIDGPTANLLFNLFGLGSIASLRSAINSESKNTESAQ